MFGMKECSRCRTLKSTSDFFARRDTPDKFAYYCKQCAKNAIKNHISSGGRSSYLKKRRTSSKIVVDQIKNNPCVDCGVTLESDCMEFDHLREKTDNVSMMMYHSLGTILKEINKCELVCVFCHRDRTHRRVGDPTTLNRFAARNRRLVISLKSVPCKSCGIQYDHWKMDFDHLPGFEKKYLMSHLSSRQRSIGKAIREEVLKCQVLCALCHRRKSVAEMEKGLRHVV